MIPVECIVRGYLAGLGLASYQASGTISGVSLPPGLTEGAKLPAPVFTPTTKAAAGHDEPLTYDETAATVGPVTAAALKRITLEIYRRGATLAAERGVIIADTKLEFGRAADGSIVLADEVLTPDSSRFWPASSWAPGRPQHSLDKQFLRDWSATLDWDRTPPGPPIPDDIVAATRAQYVDVYERLTGQRWKALTAGNAVGPETLDGIRGRQAGKAGGKWPGTARQIRQYGVARVQRPGGSRPGPAAG